MWRADWILNWIKSIYEAKIVSRIQSFQRHFLVIEYCSFKSSLSESCSHIVECLVWNLIKEESISNGKQQNRSRSNLDLVCTITGWREVKSPDLGCVSGVTAFSNKSIFSPSCARDCQLRTLLWGISLHILLEWHFLTSNKSKAGSSKECGSGEGKISLGRPSMIPKVEHGDVGRIVTASVKIPFECNGDVGITGAFRRTSKSSSILVRAMTSD